MKDQFTQEEILNILISVHIYKKQLLSICPLDIEKVEEISKLLDKIRPLYNGETWMYGFN